MYDAHTYIIGADGALVPAGSNGSHEQPLESEIKLREAINQIVSSYVDPRDAFSDPATGEEWLRMGAGDKDTSDILIETETELAAIRDECRILAQSNEFAINGHENRISYVVGSGHKYHAQAAPGMKPSEKLLTTVQQIIDDFIKENRWHQRQQEIRRRIDRDGEAFLRFFPGEVLRIRFIEPGQVSQPSNLTDDRYSWGIETDPEDVETVLQYWVDGVAIKPAEIQHRKLGADFNVKRGTPLYFAVRKNLRRAEKILRNMSVVAEIQAAIALIRKHKQATGTNVENLRKANADVSVFNANTGKEKHYKQFMPGTIIDAGAETEYDFPSQGIDAGRYVTVLQAELRAIASRLVMPEFMLSSDASNANYSSTMVAEGPAVKFFERIQWDTITDDRVIFDMLLDAAINTGQISEADRKKVEIGITPPRLETRDRKAEVEANMSEVAGKVMSKHTARVKDNLDPEFEEEKIDEEGEADLAKNPFAGMAFGQKPPDGETPPDEGDEDQKPPDDDDEEAKEGVTEEWEGTRPPGTRHEQGYDYDWVKLATDYKAEHPTCSKCTKPTAHVDHIKPFKGKDDPLRLSKSNLQPFCDGCHMEKTAVASNEGSQKAAK